MALDWGAGADTRQEGSPGSLLLHLGTFSGGEGHVSFDILAAQVV